MKQLFNGSRMAVALFAALLAFAPLMQAQPFHDFEMIVVDATTGEVIASSNNPMFDFFNISFSNDGKYLVSDAVDYGYIYGQFLAISEIETSTGWALIGSHWGNDASWSPNGNLIAFDKAPGGEPHLFTLPPEGGWENLVLVREWGVDPEWSPNSKRLVFTDVTDGSLRTVHVETEDETIVWDFGLMPSWSPNGQYIAFSDGNNLFKIRVNNAGEPLGAPIQITFDGPDVYNGQPSWSANSKTIVFHSNRGGADFDIWTVPANGGTPTLFCGTPGSGDFDPVYSNNGQMIAFSGRPPANAPESASVVPQPEKAMLQENYPNPFGSSTHIRFEAPETGSVELLVYDAQGALVRTLASGLFEAGLHEVEWDGSGQEGQLLPSGIYTCLLKVGDRVETRRMVLVKSAQ